VGAAGIGAGTRAEGPSEAVGRRTRCRVCDSGLAS